MTIFHTGAIINHVGAPAHEHAASESLLIESGAALLSTNSAGNLRAIA